MREQKEIVNEADADDLIETAIRDIAALVAFSQQRQGRLITLEDKLGQARVTRELEDARQLIRKNLFEITR